MQNRTNKFTILPKRDMHRVDKTGVAIALGFLLMMFVLAGWQDGPADGTSGNAQPAGDPQITTADPADRPAAPPGQATEQARLTELRADGE